MNTIEDLLTEYAGRITDAANEQKPTFIQYCEILSSIAAESLYILDIVQRQFIYIKPNDLFLCGHSVKEAMALGYNFFSSVVHPEDLLLWKSFLDNLPQKLQCLQENSNTQGEFFCLFRLLRKCSFIKKPLELYTYHRLIPIRKDSTHFYLIGIISYSNCKKKGCYLKGNDHFIYQFYNHKKHCWLTQSLPKLSKREIEILTIATGEQDIVAIADKLCLSYYTIQGHITSIKQKLNVQNLREATDWISYLHTLQYSQEKNIGEPIYSVPNSPSNKELKDIQALLDTNQSIRSIALMTRRSESTIRSWITKGSLKK